MATRLQTFMTYTDTTHNTEFSTDYASINHRTHFESAVFNIT